jgi:hypothetical protein
MGERKRTNNNLQDTTHKKFKIEQHESHKKNGDELGYFRRGNIDQYGFVLYVILIISWMGHK